MFFKKLKLLDIILLVITTALLLVIALRMTWSLNYHWNWHVILPYMFQTSPVTGGFRPGLLLEGLFTTLRVSLYSMVFALFIGFFIGRLRVSPRLFCRLLGRSYVETIRNMPALVLLFIFYYFISGQLLSLLGLEEIVLGTSEETQRIIIALFARPSLITQFLSGVLALALFEGAYIAEIVRGGIQSVPPGQWEAGASLGLSRHQQFRRIIMPQAMKIMLPQLANEFINTVKWSSIVSFISIQELTYDGTQIIASTNATIEVWTVVALMYLAVCLLLSLGVRRLEKHYAGNAGKAC
jgi:polar amino acid transport system permease protein